MLKPRTPDDCQFCRQERVSPVVEKAIRPPIRPWSEVERRRGAPKHLDTQGFACDNPACVYSGITDARLHALVGDRLHGKHERIPTFRCPACGRTFPCRRPTALCRLKTAPRRVAEVLASLAEGLDLSAAVRVFPHREATIARWLHRAGQRSETLHARRFRHRHLPHVPPDELRPRLRCRDPALWLWLALDPITKLIPALHLGPRTPVAARTVVHALRKRLALDCLPAFTSDALPLYCDALTAHFGHGIVVVGRKRPQWQVAAGLIYGQVKKVCRRRHLVRASYQMLLGTRDELKVAPHKLGLSGKLTTAFIERVNLTIRQSVAGLVRRTRSTAQQTPRRLAHLEWWRAYDHFSRPHGSLRVALAVPGERGGRRQTRKDRQRTPAMAAGLTNRRWMVRELLALPLGPELALAA